MRADVLRTSLCDLLGLEVPIIGMTATPNGGGYLLIGRDGGVFTFGNARFRGSTGSMHVSSPIIGAAGTSTGNGYWLATRDGRVYNFGDARAQGGAYKKLGSLRQIVQITSVPGNNGYRLLAGPAPLMIAPPLGPGSSGPAVTGWRCSATSGSGASLSAISAPLPW